MDQGAHFRDLIAQDDLAIAGGAHNPLSAKFLDTMDFDLIYLTGWGMSLARTGLPDGGLWTMTEFVDTISNVTDVVEKPVFADADDGFGDALNAGRTVRKSAKAGVAGVHIEDERPPKPVGPGREILPVDTAVGKINAARAAADAVDPEFVIIARTNIHKQQSGTIESAIGRLEQYYEAGADVVNISCESIEEYERVTNELAAPLLATGNYAQFEPEAAASIGINVLMYPTATIWASILGMMTYLEYYDTHPGETMATMESRLEAADLDIATLSGYAAYLEQEREFIPGRFERYGSFGRSSTLHKAVSDKRDE